MHQNILEPPSLSLNKESSKPYSMSQDGQHHFPFMLNAKTRTWPFEDIYMIHVLVFMHRYSNNRLPDIFAEFFMLKQQITWQTRSADIFYLPHSRLCSSMTSFPQHSPKTMEWAPTTRKTSLSSSEMALSFESNSIRNVLRLLSVTSRRSWTKRDPTLNLFTYS